MAGLLDEAAVTAALSSMHGWERDGDSIVKGYERADWNAAIALLNAVAPEAETRNHHPDVSITGYRTITFRLTTHSRGGVTQRDIELARRIDELAEASGAAGIGAGGDA